MSRRQAERLLAGRGCARYPGLVALLAEAAGPVRPGELSGESDAVAAFRRLRLAAPSTVDVAVSTMDVAVSAVDVRRPRPLLWRSPAFRLAIAVVLLAAAGTVTVKFMHLPAQTQPIPPVAPSTAPVAGSPSPSGPGPDGRSQRPSPAPTGLPPTGLPPTGLPPSGPATLAGSGTNPRGHGAPTLTAEQTTTGPQDEQVAEAAQLCGVWTDPKTDKATRDQAAQRLRQLMAVLGGPNGMPAFCKERPVGANTDKKGS
jgi:hypothetical protein